MNFLLLILISFFALPVHARLLQIIHTNDLHSYFVGYKDGRGGYAKLKTKIDELRANAQAKGIEVLQLDAGDFGEGTAFFLTKEGSASIEALDKLGAEVSIIGNHDHMLGGRVLGDQIRKANAKVKILSANLVQTQEMNLGDLVKPHIDLTRAGIKIRVIGLSTAEAHFQYPLLPGFILPAVPVGALAADEARKAGRELVIALTHIGQSSDVDLAKKSSNVDLIIGGHSHDRIEKVRYQKNKSGKPVPIVQAGAHGLVVGSLLVDVKDDNSLQVVDYKLHEILPADTEDPALADFVAEALHNRNMYFGGRWDEVIGETLIPLSGYRDGLPPTGASCWGEHMAKMSQEATGADLALHLSQFEGASLDPGKITFGDMIDNFPHVRNFGDPGWEVSTIQVSGKVLKILLKAIINLTNLGVNFYGVDYRVFRIPTFIPFLGNKQYAFALRVKGKKIDDKATYFVAFPSEVGHALKLTLPDVAKKVMPDLKNSGIFYWQIMENYIRKNSPIQCLEQRKSLPIAPDLE